MPRAFSRVVVLVLLIVLTAGGIAQASARQGEKTKLTMWAGGYSPSRLGPTMEATAFRPDIEGIDPIVAAYEKLHPEVEIELIFRPIPESRAWLITQLTGGTAPDITWTQPDWAAEDYRKNWLVPLDPYLEQPNPYVPGNQRWHDMFLPAMDVWRAADGNLYMLLGDQVQVGIYYNKEMFQEAGITEVPPRDWEDLMAAAEKLKAAGFFPFAEAGNDLNQLTWVSGWLTNYFYAPQVAEFDKNGDEILQKTEMAEAVVAGGYRFTDERSRARLEAIQRFSTYWQPGAVGADIGTANRLFLTGRAGMIITGSWDYQTFKQDPQREFDFGVFYFPPLTSRTSPLIPDGVPITNKAAGYGSFQFAVTNTAVNRGTVDVAFDFLKFATAPENLSPMVTEGGFALPAVKDSTANPELADFEASIAYRAAPYQEDDSMFDYQFAQEFLAIMTSYLSGGEDLDATASKLDEAAQNAAQRVLAE